MTEPIEEAIKKSYLDGALDNAMNALKTNIMLEENVYEMSIDDLPPIGHCDPWRKILAFSPKDGWRCIMWDDAYLHAMGFMDDKEGKYYSPCTHYTFTPEPPPVKKAQ